MDVRVGTDIVEVARIARLTDGAPAERWFTADEISYCASQAHPARHLAARFAAKEATFKALRGDSGGPVPWREVEIVTAADGGPEVRLSGALADRAAQLGLGPVRVSMSHCAEYATATAVILCA